MAVSSSKTATETSYPRLPESSSFTQENNESENKVNEIQKKHQHQLFLMSISTTTATPATPQSQIQSFILSGQNQADIEKKTHELRVRESKISLREAEATHTKSLLSGFHDNLIKTKSEFMQREAQVTQREAQVTQREAQVTQREAQVTQREVNVIYNETLMAHREKELTQREANVTYKEALLAHSGLRVTQRKKQPSNQNEIAPAKHKPTLPEPESDLRTAEKTKKSSKSKGISTKRKSTLPEPESDLRITEKTTQPRKSIPPEGGATQLSNRERVAIYLSRPHTCLEVQSANPGLPYP